MIVAPGGTTALRSGSGTPPHRRRWLPGVVQEVAPPGIHDLRLGYLDPDLLPVDLLRQAYEEAFADFGAAALSYGTDQGLVELREVLAARARRQENAPCTAANVVLTAGSSQALYLIGTALAQPGDTVLVEATHYNLARQLFVDCGLDVRLVEGDRDGMTPDAMRAALAAARAEHRHVAFAYLVPTFHNPTGRVVPERRRRDLLHVTRRHNVLVIEDDAYADLSLEPGALRPRSMAALAGYRGVIRLCTVSKTLGAGLRFGWLLTDARLAERLVAHGLFHSGGSLNHLASLAVAVLLRSGRFDAHVADLRERLRVRRDHLLSGLGDTAPGLLVDAPTGGFFLWLRFAPGAAERDLVARAAEAAVWVSPGSRFGAARESCVRLSYSFLAPRELERAGHRLARSWAALPRPVDGT